MGTTFEPIELEKLKLHTKEPATDFAASLYEELNRVRKERVTFYRSRRREYRSVIFIRKWLIALGIIALLATAFSGAARFSDLSRMSPDPVGIGLDPVGIGLAIALVAYALMTALSFWESANATSSAYFRGSTIIVAMRDLWTQFEFDQVAILARLKAGSNDEEIKSELLAAARTLAVAMDTLARTELDDWRGEIQTSLTQLASVGREGLAAVKAELKSDYEARIAKLEQAAKNKSYVTLQINGPLVGQVQISVDGGPAISSDNRKIALPETPAGPHRIQVAGKAKDGSALTADEWIELKPGIGTATIQVA